MLGHQLLKLQLLRPDEFFDGVSEQIRVFPVVVPPLKLIEVGVKVLRGDLMERPDNRAVEKAPDVLDGVGVELAPDPFFLAVIDRFMLRVAVPDALVGGPLIRHDDLGIVVSVLLDEPVERFLVGGLDGLEPDLALALDGPDNDGLVSLVAVAHALDAPAHKGFVHFDDAAQLLGVQFSHSGPDAVAEIPRRLVGNFQRPLHLVGGNALTGLNHKVEGNEPLAERKVRIMENRSGGRRELVAAGVAVELMAA